MPRSKADPDRPSECSPNRILCVGFWAVNTIAICIRMVYTITPNNGAVSSFRKCGLPCGLCRSLCTLQLCRSAFASSTTATLGMNGWLGLIHQGLAPWKKRQASLGAHRGRTASYPAAPAQIPACGFFAPGSSEVLTSAKLSSHDRYLTHHIIASGATGDMWFHDPKLFNELLKACPVVTASLTASI